MNQSRLPLVLGGADLLVEAALLALREALALPRSLPRGPSIRTRVAVAPRVTVRRLPQPRR